MSERSLSLLPAPPKAASAPPINVLHQGVMQRDSLPSNGSYTAHGYQTDGDCFDPLPSLQSSSARFGKTGDFTNVHVPQPPANITDPDVVRALITHLLVNELAPLLALDPAKLEIRVNRDAESRTNAQGANGLIEGGTIYLHPDRYRPLDRHGRALLAHEAAHAAQTQISGEADPIEAEREATAIARAYASRKPFSRPKRPLSRMAVARDRDAATVEPKAAPPPLNASVETSRSREINEIRASLSGLWISDGDVFDVMRILDTMPYPVRVAVVFAIGQTERYHLADNINPPHIYQHRMSVLACYDALQPGQLGAIDLKVFRALPIAGLTTEEIEAAAKTLRNLSDDQRQELLRSDNGPAIERIITAPRPSAAEAARLKEEAEKAATGEAALAEARKAILARKDDPGAKSLFDEIKLLLLPIERPPHPRDAVQALERLNEAKKAERFRFLYVAEQLELEGLIDSLLQLLPASRFFDTPEHSDTLVQLVQSRLPTKNARLIEDLLSYNLLDWAIRDYEALFAYRLIKLMPLTEQYRFRQRDAGKWYLRLIENLPDKDPATGQAFEGLEIRKAESKEELHQLTQGLSGAQTDEKELLYNASQVYANKLQNNGAKQTLDELIAAFKEARRGIYHDEEAMDLYRKLVALGGSSLTPGEETAGDQVLREAIVHDLDRLGYIDELFGELPDSFIFAEENRLSTVKIMLARDPARVQRHARELVSRGFTDWMVKDHEAYLAYLCVKALPQDERDGFIRDNADEWGRIQSEMSESQRQSRDLNLYIGDKAGVDRASVLAQLADAATWTDDNASLVDGLVRMAIAMTEHRFAFERSREFKAREKAGLRPLVGKYRLWDPDADRAEYKPDLLQGTQWYEEGVFSSLKTLWSGLVLLWNLDVLFVDGKMGAQVDLNDVQDFMGGDLAGAKLGDPKKRGADQPLAHPAANKIRLLVGTDGKSAQVDLPELVIDSANVQLASTTFQTGAVTLKGLHLDAAYDSDQMLQPTEAHVDVASIEATDLLLAKSNSMLTVSRLAVRALRLAAGAIDTVTRTQPGGNQPRSVPFPLLVVPLLALLALFGLPILIYRKIAGLLDQGLEANPGEHFAADVAQRTKAIKFSFGGLDLDGLTTSGGQHVRHIGVQDFALRVGLNKPTRLRAEKASIEQRLASLAGKTESSEMVAKLQQRKSEVETELVEVEKKEADYVRIQRRILQGGLAPDEQDRLQKQLTELNFEDKGAAFFDIGSIEASGISGNITSKDPIRLSNIHGEGGGAALTQFVGMPTATDKELSRRSGAGERPDPAFTAGQEGKLSIELGDVHTGEITIAGGIRSVAEFDKKIEELEPLKAVPEVAPLYESLQLLRKKAERYAFMVQRGVSALTPPELTEFRELRRVLTDQASLIIRSIDLTRATLDVDIASGRVDFGVEAARITGVQLPQKGIEIDEVIARGLGVGAMPAGGLLNWQDWKRNLKDADGTVDLLQVSGVRSKYHGLLFEKATLSGPYAKMKERGDFLEAGLKKLEVEGVGLAPRIGLLNQRLAGLEEKAKVAPEKEKAKLDTEIAQLRSKISELQTLAQARVAAYRALEAAKTLAEIEAAKEAVAESDTTIALGLAQYGASRVELEDFGVRATGAGDVLGDVLLGSGLDVDRILRRGVKVQGAGPDNRVLRRFAVTGANAKEDQSESSLAASGNFELGETKADVDVKRVGDSVFVDLNQFSIASFSLAELLMTADEGGIGMQVGSTGASRIEGVTLKGSLRMDKRPATEGKFPSDFRFAHAEINDFRIQNIRAGGLFYRSIPDKLEVSVKSGSISGIWAKDVKIDFPAEKGGKLAILGAAGIESISDVEIAGAMTDGLRLERGKINGSNLQLDFLEEGEIQATVGDLSATAMSIRGPDGWARFSLNHLSGQVNYRDGVYTATEVKLGSFVVPSIDWRAGKKHIQADKQAKIVDLRVTGKVTTRKELPKPDATPTLEGPPEPKTVISGVKISNFHIGSIVADHLIYEEGDDRVEIGAPEKDLPEEMKGFKPLFISDFTIKNLEWDEKKGLIGQGMDVDVKTFEAAAVYKNLKEGMTAGFALKGIDMGATFVGSNFAVASLGVIEKTAGFYKGGGIDTSFKTGQIIGAITFGEDFLELANLQIDGTTLGKTKYTGEDGNTIDLKTARIGKITLDKVRANYEKVKDDEGKERQVIKELLLNNLEFTDIHAAEFEYHGKSKIKNEKGEEGEATQSVHGWSADIDRLLISNITRDQKSKLTTVSFDLSNRDKTKSAFNIGGLSGDLIKEFGTKRTATHFSTDVEGGALTGENIKFQTITLGTTTGPDGKPVDVTRTSVDGTFELTSLGFINPDLTLTDEKGKTTSIGGFNNSITIRGIKPRFLPNGTVAVPIDDIIAKNLVIKKDKMAVRLPLLELKTIALGLRGMGTDKGLDLLAAKIGEIHVQGASIEIINPHKAHLSDEEYAAAQKEFEESQAAEAAEPSGKLIAEPFSDLKGEISGEYSLGYWEDPDITAKIENGTLDFGGMTNYSVQLHTYDVTREGVTRPEDQITVGNLVDLKTLKDFKRKMPGFYGDAGKYNYGRINFRELAEGLGNEPGVAPERDFEAAEGLRNFIDFSGQLSLGEGRLGRDTTGDNKLGEGDTWIEFKRDNPSQNIVNLKSKSLGDEVGFDIPELHFSGAGFTAGKTQDGKPRIGKTGDVSFKQVVVKVKGLASLTTTLTVEIQDGTIKDVQIGDVTFADAAELAKLSAPTLTEVNPKGVPKTP